MPNNDKDRIPTLEEWFEKFGTIKEARALEYEKHGALTEITIKRVDDLEYYLVLKLAFDSERFLLYTTRPPAKPRRFAHMHRLVDYLHTNFKNVEKIDLDLSPIQK